MSMATDTPVVERVSGSGVPIRGNDIDTDRIIPARFMKVVTFEGLGAHAFHDERYEEDGSLKGHPLDDPRFAGASILVVNSNFGCGSSREHAPQALARAGIRAVVGESFAEIFAGNCVSLGVPAVCLAPDDIAELMDRVEADPEAVISVDLESGTVRMRDREWLLTMPDSHRAALLSGSWNSTASLLANAGLVDRTLARLPYTAWS